MVALDIIQDVPVRHEEIARAIIVIIHEARTKATHMKSGIAHF